MKKAVRWCYPFVFLILCAAVIWFLHLFTVSDGSILFIDWQSAYQLHPDGTRTPFSSNAHDNTPSETETFLFQARLPDGLKDGHLLFETSGLELSLSLNGEELYHSYAVSPKESQNMATASIPLLANTTGEVTVTCTLSDSDIAMFPPLLRFIGTKYELGADIAYANLFGIPAGIAAVLLLLTAGLFLLSLLRQKPQWSLIPLLLASTGLMTYRLTQSCGYYFLPQWALDLLLWPGFRWLAPLALLVYLIMNRWREFMRLLGLCTVLSAAALLTAYLISLARDGYLAGYLKSSVLELTSGYYDGLLYWFTLWLTAVCAFLATWHAMRAFSQKQTEARTLALKNRLMEDSYHALEVKMRDQAAMRHDLKYRIMALNSCYQKRDWKGLGSLLAELKQQEAAIARTQFSENFSFNAILQDVALRAGQAKIAFNARVHVPAELNIPDGDLYILIMNMLDNSLEACANISGEEERFVHFNAELKNGFLAVKCENSYEGQLREDARGRFLTTKSEPELHGFGFSQMSAIAEKYHSLLDVSCRDGHIFTVQTALKLPKKKAG